MKISVITPSYNSAKYLKRAIESVLAQDYANFEHIIIDGLSTDNTINILRKFPHLKWISEKDTGQSNAMNKGFRISTGNIIVYLNADDYFLPGAFRSVIPFFKKKEIFVVGNVILQISKNKKFTMKPNVTHEGMLRHWKPNAFPNNPLQYFYLRKIQEEITFNEENYITMDYEFLLEVSSKYKLCKIEKTLGVYPLLKNAKYVTAQRKDIFSYWSYNNFNYIDKYIIKMSKENIINFKNEQQEAYNKIIKNNIYRRKMLNKIKTYFKTQLLKIKYALLVK